MELPLYTAQQKKEQMDKNSPPRQQIFPSIQQKGSGGNVQKIEDLKKHKFEKYLIQVFRDLATKDNGLQRPQISQYIFNKYTQSSQTSLLLSRRLFEIMATNMGAQGVTPNRGISSQEENKNNPYQNSQPNIYQNGGAKQANGLNDNKLLATNEGHEEQQNQVVEEEAFLKMFLIIYFGTSREQREIVFQILDIQQAGTICSENARILLLNIFTVTRPRHQDLLFHVLFKFLNDCQAESTQAQNANKKREITYKIKNDVESPEAMKNLKEQAIESLIKLTFQTEQSTDSILKEEFVGDVAQRPNNQQQTEGISNDINDDSHPGNYLTRVVINYLRLIMPCSWAFEQIMTLSSEQQENQDHHKHRHRHQHHDCSKNIKSPCNKQVSGNQFHAAMNIIHHPMPWRCANKEEVKMHQIIVEDQVSDIIIKENAPITEKVPDLIYNKEQVEDNLLISKKTVEFSAHFGVNNNNAEEEEAKGENQLRQSKNQVRVSQNQVLQNHDVQKSLFKGTSNRKNQNLTAPQFNFQNSMNTPENNNKDSIQQSSSWNLISQSAKVNFNLQKNSPIIGSNASIKFLKRNPNKSDSAQKIDEVDEDEEKQIPQERQEQSQFQLKMMNYDEPLPDIDICDEMTSQVHINVPLISEKKSNFTVLRDTQAQPELSPHQNVLPFETQLQSISQDFQFVSQLVRLVQKDHEDLQQKKKIRYHRQESFHNQTLEIILDHDSVADSHSHITDSPCGSSSTPQDRIQSKIAQILQERRYFSKSPDTLQNNSQPEMALDNSLSKKKNKDRSEQTNLRQRRKSFTPGTLLLVQQDNIPSNCILNSPPDPHQQNKKQIQQFLTINKPSRQLILEKDILLSDNQSMLNQTIKFRGRMASKQQSEQQDLLSRIKNLSSNENKIIEPLPQLSNEITLDFQNVIKTFDIMQNAVIHCRQYKQKEQQVKNTNRRQERIIGFYQSEQDQKQSEGFNLSQVYFEIQGPDLIAFRSLRSHQIRFMHSLAGCTFSLENFTLSFPDNSDKHKQFINEEGNQSAKDRDVSQRSPQLMIRSQESHPNIGFQLKQRNPNSLLSNILKRPQTGSSQSRSQPALQDMQAKMIIKISEGHKRVFYFRNYQEAETFMTELESCAKFFSKSDYKKYKKVLDFENKPILLGEGSYGKVYRAINSETNENVALKVISKKSLTQIQMILMQQEIDVMWVLRDDDHPGVIKLLDAFEENQELNIIMELIEGGSNLYNFVMEVLKPAKFDERKSKGLFLQLCEAMQYYQQRGVVHRDIKFDNIMMIKQDTMQTHPKFLDFGLSTTLLKGETNKRMLGSIAFLSPEIVSQEPHSHSTDIWSLGIILYIMLTGCFPFIHTSAGMTMHNIKLKAINFRQQCWMGVSDPAKDLVSKMLHKDPYQRIDIQSILNHPWLNIK